MSDYLPPGCSSADGGIDHALEAAIDSLVDQIETPEEANALKDLLPAIRPIIADAFQAGEQEGKLFHDQ